MSNSRVQTSFTNTGPKRYVPYLSPNGGQMDAGQTVTMSGLLESSLALNYPPSVLQAFLTDQAMSLITVTYTITGINSGASFTPGSVIFANSSGQESEDNANFFYDNVGKGLGLGTTTPSSTLDMTGALTVRGMTAPAVSASGTGVIYFDSGTNQFMVSENGGAYAVLVGGGGGSSAFNAITSGINTTATMTFGVGSQMMVDPGGNGVNQSSIESNTTVAGAFAGFALDGTGLGFNTLIGSGAATNMVSGSHNTAVGVSALGNNVTGSNNVALGYKALISNTVDANVAVGYQALQSNSNGLRNTAVGFNAMRFQSTVNDADNTAVGYQAGMNMAISASGGNTLIGSQVAATLTSGTSNVVVGFMADVHSGSGSQLVVVGASAGTTTQGVSIGGFAGSASMSGISNTIVGWGSGSAISTGSRNTLLGAAVGQSLTTGDSNVLLGTGAAATMAAGAQNIIIGDSAGNNVTDDTQIVVIGYQAGQGALSGNTGSVFVGFQAGFVSTGNNNVGVGWEALWGNTTGADNIGIGASAGNNTTTGSHNVSIGTGAQPSQNTDSSAVSIGYSAIAGNLGVTLGSGAGHAGSTGAANTIVGQAAGISLSSGNLNVIIGQSAAQSLNTGASNVLIGYNVIGLQSGGQNVLMGATCSSSGTGTSDSVGIGYGVISASQCVTIGSGASTNSNVACIAIGYHTHAATGGLIIGQSKNSSTGNDLIVESGDVGIRRVGATILTITDGNGGAGALSFNNMNAPATALGTGVIYYDTATNKLMASENNGAFVDIIGGGGSPAFSAITSGTNTTATMTVGSGCTVLVDSGGSLGECAGNNTSTILGNSAGLTADGGTINCTFIGYSAGLNASGRANITCVGAQAGGSTIAEECTYIGSSAGKNAAGVNDNDNTFVGYQAGLNASGAAVGQNTLIGANTAATLTTGDYNTILGTSTDVFAATTANAILIGTQNSGHTDSIIIGTSKTSSTANDLIIETPDVGLRRVAATVLSVSAGSPSTYGTLKASSMIMSGIQTVTTTYVVALADFLVKCDATGGGFPVTLPPASDYAGRIINIKKIDSSANAITLTPDGTDTIETAATLPISVQYVSITLISDGVSDWSII